MPHYAISFFIVAIVAGTFGFKRNRVVTTDFASVLFFLSIALFLGALFLNFFGSSLRYFF